MARKMGGILIVPHVRATGHELGPGVLISGPEKLLLVRGTPRNESRKWK